MINYSIKLFHFLISPPSVLFFYDFVDLILQTSYSFFVLDDFSFIRIFFFQWVFTVFTEMMYYAPFIDIYTFNPPEPTPLPYHCLFSWINVLCLCGVGEDVLPSCKQQLGFVFTRCIYVHMFFFFFSFLFYCFLLVFAF